MDILPTKTKTLVFPKKETRGLDVLREKFSFKIPERLASAICVRIKLVSDIPIVVSVCAEKKIINPLGNIGYNARRTTQDFHIDPNGTFEREYCVSFPKDKNDFVCDMIMIDCNADNTDVIIEASIREQK
jgi:hypothetical protein